MSVKPMVNVVLNRCAKALSVRQRAINVAKEPNVTMYKTIVLYASALKDTLEARTPNVNPSVLEMLIARLVDLHASMEFARIHVMVPVELVPIVIYED